MTPIVPPIAAPSLVLPRRDLARTSLTKAIGTDKLWYVVNGVYIRHEINNGEKQYSIIDTVDIFTNTKNDPRRYWNDKKKSLIGSNTELSEKIGQLKMVAPDGKRRATDVAPLWALLGIISRLDTEPANDLINAIFRGVAGAVENAALRYHAMNIENGSEWAANGVHIDMKRLKPVSDSELEWWER